PTITFVGTLEPFYWETQAYVKALGEAGVPVRYQEFDRCFHAFDAIAGGSAIGRQAQAFTYASFAEFYDRYVEV
ncbi:MAG: alpha/beta hydrolase, partial [Pseudomonadota bacterium]|nr:alpha/beta hydrolase [Pseudomonadota bacterium]